VHAFCTRIFCLVAPASSVLIMVGASCAAECRTVYNTAFKRLRITEGCKKARVPGKGGSRLCSNNTCSNLSRWWKQLDWTT